MGAIVLGIFRELHGVDVRDGKTLFLVGDVDAGVSGGSEAGVGELVPLDAGETHPGEAGVQRWLGHPDSPIRRHAVPVDVAVRNHQGR